MWSFIRNCSKSKKDSLKSSLILITKQNSMITYKGKIRIEGVGTAIDVSTSASSPSAAKKIIENMYKVKHWVNQMSKY